MTQPLLQIQGISKQFQLGGALWRSRSFKALDDVTLEVSEGQTLGIVGESGSGKSTLLRAVLRLMQPSSGQILINGENVWSLRGDGMKRFRRSVQPIFQNPASSFNPRQTIRSILLAPLEVHAIGTKREREDKVIALLERVGLPADAASRLPHQLSGGQKQRIAIARAVIMSPRIILADEPTSALDVSVQAQVLDLFRDIKSEMGLTSIFVSHNLAVIRNIADHVAVMRQGQVVEYGPVERVFSAPEHPYTRDLLAAIPDHGAMLDEDPMAMLEC